MKISQLNSYPNKVVLATNLKTKENLLLQIDLFVKIWKTLHLL